MLIVISSETEILDEASKINQLFSVGMTLFHLRKPFASRKQCKRLITAIDAQYHQYIMLHQFYDLVAEFQVKGVHLKEGFRDVLQDKGSDFTQKFQREGFCVSASFHTREKLEACTIPFDYFLLSPVFDSLSKKGYKGKGFDVSNSHKTIVGLGGITEKTIPSMERLGYKGMAVLGAVWGTENPVLGFKKIKESYESCST